VGEELSAAGKAYSEAWYEHRYEPARQRGEAVLSGKERFLVAVGTERGARSCGPPSVHCRMKQAVNLIPADRSPTILTRFVLGQLPILRSIQA
jgi:hypothetical protein